MAIIITGGSRGIGLATALRLAKAGRRLVLTARDESALSAAVTRVRSSGAECWGHAADVSDPEQAERVVAFGLEQAGRIDGLVNNAGAAPLAKITATSDAMFSSLLGVNVSAVFYMTRAVWPRLVSAGGGVIVNLSSLASVDPFPGFAAYGACKAWVNAFTKASADEGRSVGIRVYAVAPGAVETRMLRSSFPNFPASGALDPDDVAGAIEAAMDARLQHATGQTIFVKR